MSSQEPASLDSEPQKEAQIAGHSDFVDGTIFSMPENDFSDRDYLQVTNFDCQQNTDRSKGSNFNFNTENEHQESRTIRDGIESDAEIRLNSRMSAQSLSSVQQAQHLGEAGIKFTVGGFLESNGFAPGDSGESLAFRQQTSNISPKKRFSGT